MAGLLTAIGTGLGGFMQGYDQARQSAQLAQARQMALQQVKDQNIAKGLAGFALANGGILNPVGGVPASQQGPQPPMPGQSSQPAQQQMMPPQAAPDSSPYGPGPGMPAVAAAQQPPGQPPPMQGSAWSPDLGRQPGTTPEMQGSAGSPDLGADEQRQRADFIEPQDRPNAQASPAEQVGRDVTAEPYPVPEPSATAAAATSSPPSSAARAATGPAGASAPAAPPAAEASSAPGGQPFIATDDRGQQVDIRPFLPQHFDPQQIAQRIKAARPDATDAQIWDATEMVYKLAESGNKNDVASSALLLRALGLNIQAQKARTGAALGAGRLAVAQQNAATTAGRAQVNEDLSRQRLAVARERLDQQKTQFDARLMQAKSQGSTVQRGQALRAMLSDVDRLINAPIPPDDKTLKQLNTERAQLVNELRRITGMSGVQPLPQPAPAAPASGGFFGFGQ